MARENPYLNYSNDDGIGAKGINELIVCLKDLGELVVMAPDGPRSGWQVPSQSQFHNVPVGEKRRRILNCL